MNFQKISEKLDGETTLVFLDETCPVTHGKVQIDFKYAYPDGVVDGNRLVWYLQFHDPTTDTYDGFLFSQFFDSASP